MRNVRFFIFSLLNKSFLLVLFLSGWLILQPEEATVIDMFDVNKPVSMRIRNGGRYMSSFMKATTLSNTVSIILLKNLAVVVEYKIAEMKIPEIGYLRFYIPPITSPTS